METLYQISSLLKTDIDRQTLALIVSLIEQGVNPEALAITLKELKKETKKKK